jgi:hypothetical protein
MGFVCRDTLKEEDLINPEVAASRTIRRTFGVMA